jgi:hypothetical protein
MVDMNLTALATLNNNMQWHVRHYIQVDAHTTFTFTFKSFSRRSYPERLTLNTGQMQIGEEQFNE